jgi:hypothetical protein
VVLYLFTFYLEIKADNLLKAKFPLGILAFAPGALLGWVISVNH